MAERLSFGRERGPGSSLGLVLSILVFVAAAVALGWTRGWWGPGPAPDGPWFEIRGDVPRPGIYAVATLHGLLTAAGAPVEGVDRRLVAGELVVVEDGAVWIMPTDDPLVVGLPLDVDTASVAALDAVPGISAATAEAIVADRDAHGPFGSVDGLRRVKGVGPRELDALRPFVAGP